MKNIYIVYKPKYKHINLIRQTTLNNFNKDYQEIKQYGTIKNIYVNDKIIYGTTKEQKLNYWYERLDNSHGFKSEIKLCERNINKLIKGE